MSVQILLQNGSIAHVISTEYKIGYVELESELVLSRCMYFGLKDLKDVHRLDIAYSESECQYFTRAVSFEATEFERNRDMSRVSELRNGLSLNRPGTKNTEKYRIELRL